ncbi:hypothetical protein [Priestia koreensis]|nr:hypothetical protein [Priestia koreensis]
MEDHHSAQALLQLLKKVQAEGTSRTDGDIKSFINELSIELKKLLDS